MRANKDSFFRRKSFFTKARTKVLPEADSELYSQLSSRSKATLQEQQNHDQGYYLQGSPMLPLEQNLAGHSYSNKGAGWKLN